MIQVFDEHDAFDLPNTLAGHDPAQNQPNSGKLFFLTRSKLHIFYDLYYTNTPLSEFHHKFTLTHA
jgi:hypothetical protein